MDRSELLWRQYSQNVELYKFYMDLALKFNIFYYAVTGAILSFYFAQNGDGAVPVPDSNIKYSLLLPILMSVAFAGFFIYGACLMRHLREEVFAIGDELGLAVTPDLRVLSVLLFIFSSVFIVVAVGCGYLIWQY